VQIAVGAGLSFAATAVHAGNGTKPRVLVDWTGTPCMTIVDRSVDPVLNIEYSVAKDDTELTPDEVDDSRTHQFFAFCRTHDLQTFLPRWIKQDDIDRAQAKGSAPDMILPEDVLDTNTTWADCWYRVNADDARRPITVAAAAEGVDWNTSTVPAGTYRLEGYTFEPPFNVWSMSPGVVKVVDDPDPAASDPAIAVENTEELLYRDETVAIRGCVSAMDGATITAYFAAAGPAAQWQPFIEDEPVVGTSFAVDLTSPEELVGESAMIRVDVTDPMGRTFTNYMREFVVVLDSVDPNGCPEESGGAGCGDSGEGTIGESTISGSGGADGDASTGVTPEQDDTGGDGCGCRAPTNRAPSVAGLLAFGVLGIRRRRRTGWKVGLNLPRFSELATTGDTRRYSTTPSSPSRATPRRRRLRFQVED
jgi:MYXO-CTERM domain-containing protein